MTRIGIADPRTLLGKEICDLLGRQTVQWDDLRLFTMDEEGAGAITEVAGEPRLVSPYSADILEGIDFLFCCGPAQTLETIMEDCPADTRVVVLSPDAELETGLPIVTGVNDYRIEEATTLISPHAAVIALAHLIHPLRQFGPCRAVATVIQSASTKGDEGIEELIDQTRSILSFSESLPKDVYGCQMAFNLVSEPGGARNVSRQLESVLSDLPSAPVQLLRGGIFHGLALSVNLQFEQALAPADIRAALARHPQVELVESDPESPRGPIDAAASDRVMVEFSESQEESTDYWFWVLLDNLTRGGAVNAIEIAETLLASAPN